MEAARKQYQSACQFSRLPRVIANPFLYRMAKAKEQKSLSEYVAALKNFSNTLFKSMGPFQPRT